MTKEKYKKRLTEIYNEIGALASERDMLVNEMARHIEKDLESIGLKYGMKVNVVDDGIERECYFNGVRVNSQHHIYLEFTYSQPISLYDTPTSYYVERMCVVDINHNIDVILPESSFNYQTYINKFQ